IESYTHRSGRTGRANKSGISISIVHSKESGRIRMIEKIINKKFEKGVVPTGLDVCQSQLFSLINKMKEAQVDEQIEQYLPIVIEQLNDMDKETIIKKFVSLEFNRFLNYYKDAQDINVEGRDNSERSKKRRNGDLIRLKINLGQKDGFTPKRILGIINDTTGDKGIEIRDIEITPRYSFFDVDSSDVKRMIDAFAANDNDGVVLAEAKESRSRSFDRGGDRSGSDRGGDRGGFDRGGDRSRSRSDRDRGDRDRSSFRDRDRSHDRDRRSDSSSEWRHTKEENAFSKKSSKKYSRDSFSRHK
ncbi:MAG TPA: DEAD/DEAH box helicase, partial [Paludibacteraceae bacterium]|nr:DEAD/DEAH box helicase [Paludibacteraceae bacterium]